jgi:hypothetical protein
MPLRWSIEALRVGTRLYESAGQRAAYGRQRGSSVRAISSIRLVLGRPDAVFSSQAPLIVHRPAKGLTADAGVAPIKPDTWRWVRGLE